MAETIRLLARAVILKDGAVLLAHALGRGNTFLPGGTVHPGETLTQALARELEEELGVAVRVGGYLGGLEALWEDGGRRHHEINHVFEAMAEHLAPPAPPASREPHLEFFWSSLDDLDRRNLLPAPLRQRIRRWVAGERSTWWATDLD